MKLQSVNPLINKKQSDLVKKKVADAVEKGVVIKLGGKQSKNNYLKDGNYFEFTILINVNFNIKVMSEETFGPVMPIVPFDPEDEVFFLANITSYGLSAEIYTSNFENGINMAREVYRSLPK